MRIRRCDMLSHITLLLLSMGAYDLWISCIWRRWMKSNKCEYDILLILTFCIYTIIATKWKIEKIFFFVNKCREYLYNSMLVDYLAIARPMHPANVWIDEWNKKINGRKSLFICFSSWAHQNDAINHRNRLDRHLSVDLVISWRCQKAHRANLVERLANRQNRLH